MELGDLIRALQKDYQKLGSWRLVAARWRLSKGMAYRIAVQGYEPKAAELRLALGLLLPSARVRPVTGAVPDGTLVIHALRCACGQWYVPNHPRRKKCFLCSPYRGAGRPARAQSRANGAHAPQAREPEAVAS